METLRVVMAVLSNGEWVLLVPPRYQISDAGSP